jgi:hypothetical protein
MERLASEPDCAAITAVYVRPTGFQPPAETWKHIMVSRRATVPKTNRETAAMLKVLNAMRNEYDLMAR